MRSFEDFKKDFFKDKLDLGIFMSINELEEDIVVDVSKKALKISTIQKNGWIRVNIYYKDGTTEEYYEN